MHIKLAAFAVVSLLVGAWLAGAALWDSESDPPLEQSRIVVPPAAPEQVPGVGSEHEISRLSDVGAYSPSSPGQQHFLAEPEDLSAVQYLAKPEAPNLVCFIPTVYGPTGVCSTGDVALPVSPPGYAPAP